MAAADALLSFKKQLYIIPSKNETLRLNKSIIVPAVVKLLHGTLLILYI
jgi:hypothetical protein